MRPLLISIGDELLNGKKSDTNLLFIGSELQSIGIPLAGHVTVGDDKERIKEEFSHAWRKFDLIIVTGGLGPTHDDLTVSCISDFFRSPLRLNRKVLNSIKRIFNHRGKEMPESNIKQAYLPEISEPLRNSIGTAPGLLIRKNGKIFCSLPGVPAEMRAMFRNCLKPLLTESLSWHEEKVIRSKTFCLAAVGESFVYEILQPVWEKHFKADGEKVRLSYLPSPFEIHLGVNVMASDKRTASRLLRKATEVIRKAVGEFIYSDDGSSLPEKVSQILKQRRLTLSVAESCTGGLVSSMLTDVPGSSEYFIDSVISYSNKAKERFLGVKHQSLVEYGAVSREVAIEMARGIRKMSDTDIGLSTTGIAGPKGATKTKPIGLVWIGYSDRESLDAVKFIFSKDRIKNKEMMSKAALNFLRKKIINPV